MVDEYIGCTRKDEDGKKACDGVMLRQGADSRGKNVKFVCPKCGKTESYGKRSFDAGRHVFSLNHPTDPLRGSMK